MPLIVVYLWKESDGLPQGHSAMKIEDNTGSQYFSWWPSHNGRATPPTYGPNGTARKPKEGAANAERQLRDMNVRELNNRPGEERHFKVKSDKEMLQSGDLPKHATFKFFFRSDLDVGKAKATWEALLASDAQYDSATFNCHMPVAEALIQAFASHVHLNDKGRVEDKAAKKLIASTKSGQLTTETTNNAAWSVAKTARLCSLVAHAIDEGPLEDDSKVIVRHNDFANGTLSKRDYAGGEVNFESDPRTGRMTFVQGDAKSGKINPRMSSDHHKSEALADAAHFSSASSGDSNSTSSSVPTSMSIPAAASSSSLTRFE